MGLPRYLNSKIKRVMKGEADSSYAIMSMVRYEVLECAQVWLLNFNNRYAEGCEAKEYQYYDKNVENNTRAILKFRTRMLLRDFVERKNYTVPISDTQINSIYEESELVKERDPYGLITSSIAKEKMDSDLGQEFVYSSSRGHLAYFLECAKQKRSVSWGDVRRGDQEGGVFLNRERGLRDFFLKSLIGSEFLYHNLLSINCFNDIKSLEKIEIFHPVRVNSAKLYAEMKLSRKRDLLNTWNNDDDEEIDKSRFKYGVIKEKIKDNFHTKTEHMHKSVTIECIIEYKRIAISKFFVSQYLKYRRDKEKRLVYEMNSLLCKKESNKSNSRIFTPKQRAFIFDRDSQTCQLCLKNAEVLKKEGLWLEVDHIVPFSEGGDTTIENGQTLCNSCNIGTYYNENTRSTCFANIE